MPDLAILAGISTVAAAITGLLTIWNFFQSPAKQNAADIAALGASINGKIDALGKALAEKYQEIDDKVDAVAARVSTLETVIKHMPNKDSLHQLEVTLVRVSERMGALSDKLTSVETLSRRLQSMMLEEGSSHERG